MDHRSTIVTPSQPDPHTHRHIRLIGYTSPAMPTYQNQHGRKPGRGWRPWILLPKVLAVAIYFGGLAAVLILWFTSDLPGLKATNPHAVGSDLTAIINQMHLLFSRLVLPSLFVTDVLGVLLLLQHPRLLLKQRWLQVKLLLLALVLPAMHLFYLARFHTLVDAVQGSGEQVSAAQQLTWGLPLLLIASAGIIVLGRLKPSLGQNWARSYRKTVAATTPPDKDPS